MGAGDGPVPEPELVLRKFFSADIQSTCSKRAESARMENRQSGFAELPAEAWRLHSRLYIDAQEAELGPQEGCPCPPHQWRRSDDLYPRRRTQSAGALDCADPRRSRKGPSGRSLSRGSRSSRHRRCGEAQAEPFEVRREAAQGGDEVVGR